MCLLLALALDRGGLLLEVALRPVERGGRALDLRVARLGEGAPAAAEAGHADRRKLDDPVHLFEQFAVVAGDQRAAVPAGEQFGDRGAALGVEIVGRLVHQQHRRLGQQHRREAEPRALAAAERGDVAVERQW